MKEGLEKAGVLSKLDLEPHLILIVTFRGSLRRRSAYLTLLLSVYPLHRSSS